MGNAHADYLVDLVDSHGAVVGQKPRYKIDKSVDLYHGVYVLLVTPARQYVLSVIPERADLPNVYAHKFGSTVASIRRSGEDAEAAARRALEREVGLVSSDLRHLGDNAATLADGRVSYLSAFVVTAEVPESFSTQDITAVRPVWAAELDELVTDHAQQVAATLQFIWMTYRSQLVTD